MKALILISTLLLTANTYTFDYSRMTCKHKCSQMNSCKEAYFYLEVCGVKKLDRDNNVIPYEKIHK